MTSTFWKWLSRANARTAVLAAAIALIAAGAYWVWRELDLVVPDSGYHAGMEAEQPAITNRVQLLAFIKGQQENKEKAATNPFHRRPVWQNDPPSANTRNTDPVKQQPAIPAVKPAVAVVKPPPPPPPPPPPKEIPVLYRGFMTRPDGSVAALIENQETQRQQFFAAGDMFLNATVEGIGGDSVSLRLADGAVVTLARGQAARIREK